ncbi:dephospho-CoA kinase [Lactobacillus pasteurii DSM 23907 = CRBIP 24.76]|uniref:Dephospho-CoA kinase n=1 Tax=Lactobacillus pasteurii DSM 23907 = CRBIP 24.76 TaxID=1423790 RepID=I7LEI4_9LACO|nr:dephospho-CoA kinase [Lactobacillus pasteurii]KRK08340.1 dephospho-CoA kinase [Lactobacillus pasteurii DSM 23907 = CRBIP 24.76]TDG75518.1 hypothetical protein C5L33_000403 [Lactobacillus pasteurii]CCI85803.1 Dephospho-CoA kinase [Lactobacillus pasteurii DSM 23907 = CRBIP 24.76]
MTIVLGLTGGIATGKSTADEFFRKQNIPIIDADQISREILNIGKPAWEQVKQQFGLEFFNADQTVNRRKLGQYVFSHKSELEKLNQITHPLIHEEIVEQIQSAKQKNLPLIILDAPVLFETGGEKDCDQVLVIALPEQEQLKRLMKRNNYDEKEAMDRIRSQMPLAQKIAKANYVVENTGTIIELEDKLAEVLRKIED